MIKNYLQIFTLFSCIVLLFHCSNRNSIPNIETKDFNENYISVDVDSPNPEYAAMYQLLFRGIEGSSQKVPLISVSETSAMNSNPAYFDSFFKKERYKTFVTSSTNYGKGVRRVVINLRALKLDLEYHAIIKKFGY